MLDLDNISYKCIITLTQGHIAIVKVTVNTWQKLFMDHYLSRVTWIGMTLHTTVVHDPGVVIAGEY